MERRVGTHFRLGPRIGSGSFGEIYAGTHAVTSEDVAIKTEPVRTRCPQLQHERSIYRTLHNNTEPAVGFPLIKWSGFEENHNVLIMDRLGQSLEELFDCCNRVFSLKTVLVIADQMLQRLEYVHSKGLIHRDIKPDNILIGCTSSTKNLFYLIDFGLSKYYYSARLKRHIPNKKGYDLTGTARYASVNTHLGCEQSRRDDLESLGYVLLYFLRGVLPWQGLDALTKKQKYQRILHKKQQTVPTDLCRGFPPEFKAYFEHCRKLHFETKPDYAHLRHLFRDLFERSGFVDDGQFDWVVAANKKAQREQQLQQQDQDQEQDQEQAVAMGVSSATAAPAEGTCETGGALSDDKTGREVKDVPATSTATVTAQMNHLAPLVNPAVCAGHPYVTAMEVEQSRTTRSSARVSSEGLKRKASYESAM